MVQDIVRQETGKKRGRKNGRTRILVWSADERLTQVDPAPKKSYNDQRIEKKRHKLYAHARMVSFVHCERRDRRESDLTMFCSVILIDRPIEPLTYEAIAGVCVGAVVQVPVRSSSATGIVVDMKAEKPGDFNVKKVIELVEERPIMSQPMARMIAFMASYYKAPLGMALKLAMPGGMMRAGRCLYFRGMVEPVGEAGKKICDILGDRQLSGRELALEAGVTSACLEEMAAKGELNVEWILDRTRRVESVVAEYRPVPGAEPTKKLGAKQQALFDFVCEYPDGIRYNEIAEKFGSVVQILRRLEEMGLITSAEKTKNKSSFDDVVPVVKDVVWTDEQREAIETIVSHEGFGGFLLHGVTGSGKTEVYMGVMEAVRKRGKGCILMLPEIALTPQFCAIFKGRFGNDVAVLHSGLSETERYDTWNRIRTRRLNIVIGPRSALFAPVCDLGLIVVDEEHDPSFKQDETPRYHARDMALVLGQFAGCPVILGSATPSMESYARACEGKLQKIVLTRRPQARPMPNIDIVDMRNRKQPELPPDLDEETKQFLLLKHRLISDKLENALKETYARHEQAIVFLNRRGFSTWLQCRYCGQPLYCPHCNVALTYHKYANLLRCHYCNYEQPLIQTCPKCRRPEIELTGFGTERVVDVLKACVPGASIDRLDRDRATPKGLRDTLERFREGKTDILVGTQMVAKGHDIHNVTLVGIVSADMSLNMPDFRASERTFQLLTQVSGRAGRGDRPGNVVIQAMRPDHPVLQFVVGRAYDDFASSELMLRKTLHYPPFVSMVMFRIEGEDPVEVERFAEWVSLEARRIKPVDAEMLGPAPAPIAMLAGRMRFQIFFKHPSRNALHRWVEWLLTKLSVIREKNPHIYLSVDVDPLSML
ncbi:MAG: primosomal protein N' [Proteobacteria bacterium]|nr:primosomal protein N' [Pseudomonadota bacterium]